MAPSLQARPRNADEVASLPHRPEVVAAARERGIAQVVHFTTVSGLTGVLASKAVKSRSRLPTDKYLEHVYQPNSAIRKDRAWLDYVNLSITRINDWMFDSSASWHVLEDNPWVFLPSILSYWVTRAWFSRRLTTSIQLVGALKGLTDWRPSLHLRSRGGMAPFMTVRESSRTGPRIARRRCYIRGKSHAGISVE